MVGAVEEGRLMRELRVCHWSFDEESRRRDGNTR